MRHFNPDQIETPLFKCIYTISADTYVSVTVDS